MTTSANVTPVSGLHKLMLTGSAAQAARSETYRMDQWPLMPLGVSDYVPPVEAIGEPVAANLLSDEMLNGAVQRQSIEDILKPILKLVPPLSGKAGEEMFTFVNTCAHWMDGGLPVAVDWALLLWVLPALDRSRQNVEAITPLLAEYPLSRAAL